LPVPVRALTRASSSFIFNSISASRLGNVRRRCCAVAAQLAYGAQDPDAPRGGDWLVNGGMRPGRKTTERKCSSRRSRVRVCRTSLGTSAC
jgi:hypothetical protein